MSCLQDTRGCSFLKFIKNLFTLLLLLLLELCFQLRNHLSLLRIANGLAGLGQILERALDLLYDKHLLNLLNYLIKLLAKFKRNAPLFLEFYLLIHLLIYQNVFLLDSNCLFLGPKFRYDHHLLLTQSMKKCLETNKYH